MRFIFALVLTLLLLGCAHSQRDGALYQVSLIDALLAGEYDGAATVGDLRRHGDFGIGTFDRLDGELILLDGVTYRAQADGTVERVADAETTPFAAVTWFEADRQIAFSEPLALPALQQRLDELLGNPNLFYAVRIDCTPASLTIRSVPTQSKPYRPLVEVVKNQSVWTHEGISGTLVGLRCPEYSAGLNVPGYHWHFISADRRVGGHVLQAELPACVVMVDRMTDWRVALPDNDEHFGKVDLGAERRRELEQVEK